MRYLWFLRSVNLGKKNKGDMPSLKRLVEELGYINVFSYINSGNLMFDSDGDINKIKNELNQLLKAHYDFDISFCLISGDDYLYDLNRLPAWWKENLARKDVLLYTDSIDKQLLINLLEDEEYVYIGDIGIFIGLSSEKDYKKAAYVKKLAKCKLLDKLSLRNSNTFNKMAEFLK